MNMGGVRDETSLPFVFIVAVDGSSDGLGEPDGEASPAFP